MMHRRLLLTKSCSLLSGGLFGGQSAREVRCLIAKQIGNPVPDEGPQLLRPLLLFQRPRWAFSSNEPHSCNCIHPGNTQIRILSTSSTATSSSRRSYSAVVRGDSCAAIC